MNSDIVVVLTYNSRGPGTVSNCDRHRSFAAGASEFSV